MNGLTRLYAAFQTLGGEESLINTMSENVLKLSWTSTTVEDQVSDHHDAVSMTNTTRVKKSLKQRRNSLKISSALILTTPQSVDGAASCSKSQSSCISLVL